MDFASNGLYRCAAGFTLGLVGLWLVLLCLSGFSMQKATVLGGLFLASPFLRLYFDASLAACFELALLLAVTGWLCWMVCRFAKGIWQFPLFAGIVMAFAFYGAYTLSVQTLV